MSKRVGRGASWSVVILLLFVFFPVGIFLLVRKVTLEIDSYTKNGTVMQTLGGVLLALGLMYTFLGLTGALVDENGNSATAVVLGICVFGLGGIALLIQGVRYWRRGKIYTRYLTLIGMQHLRSLPAIAAAYPTSYEAVCRDLQGLLDRGFGVKPERFLPGEFLALPAEEGNQHPRQRPYAAGRQAIEGGLQAASPPLPLQAGIAADLAQHPLGLLAQAGRFRVGIAGAHHQQRPLKVRIAGVHDLDDLPVDAFYHNPCLPLFGFCPVSFGRAPPFYAAGEKRPLYTL